MIRNRPTIRWVSRCVVRRRQRATVRVRWRGPDCLGEALAAFRRAIRAHGRLARLAPSFFDAAVVDRERENRLAQQRWLEMWEPCLARAYGVEPEPVRLADASPRLPSARTCHAVERHLAQRELWFEAGRLAMERYRRRYPHDLPGLPRLARLLQLALDLKKLALGLDSPNQLPEKITYDYGLTDWQRAYGRSVDPPSSSGVAAATGPAATAADSTPGSASVILIGAEPDAAAVPAVSADSSASPAPRCDAWSRLARRLRRPMIA